MPALYVPVAFLLTRRVVVRGRSMVPTLVPGERVLFDRLAYRQHRPRLGDIVLATHPTRPGLHMIKRIAATAGDRRDDPRGRLYAPAENEYWLLGDNPEASTDSRQFGAFALEQILARAWLVYWPPDRVRRL